jgi:hypothetical protein
MSTESSVPVTTAVTTAVNTSLTEQEKIDLYNKYKSELTYVELYSKIGKYMFLGLVILFLVTVILYIKYINKESNKKLKYSIFVWFLLLSIAFISSATICFIALRNKIMGSPYRENYNSMYNQAANSQELIDLYTEIVGKNAKSISGSHVLTGAAGVFSIVLLLFTLGSAFDCYKT